MQTFPVSSSDAVRRTSRFAVELIVGNFLVAHMQTKRQAAEAAPAHGAVELEEDECRAPAP
jgi:hypothetical protein